MNLQEALLSLEPLDGDQWTADGAPLLEVLKTLTGIAVSRQEVLSAAPDFNRKSAEKPEDLLMNSKDKDDEEPKEVEEADSPTAEEDVEDLPESSEQSEESVYSVDTTSMSAHDLIKLLQSTPESQLKDFREAVHETHKEVVRAKQDADKAMVHSKRLLDITKNFVKTVVPEQTNAENIRAYLDQSQATRLERVQRSRSALKGLSPEDFNSKSPLDMAMGHRRAKNTARPNRMPKK